MSNELKEYESLIREKMRERKASPPPSVWKNIERRRSFGHKVAQKIASNWRTFGLFALLSIVGSGNYIVSELDQNSLFENHLTVNKIVNTESGSKIFESTNTINSSNIKSVNYTALSWVQPKGKEEFNLPELTMTASNSGIGFGKPFNNNPHVYSLIEQIDNWESGNAASAIRYNYLEGIPILGVQEPIVVKTAEVPKEDFDYVIPRSEEKTFWERSSIIFAITPQMITKNITPGFNLSSEEIIKRKNSEKTRLAYSLIANLRYKLKNHQFIESGVMYTKIYEEVHLEGEKQFSNQYNFVEIPLLFGYGNREAKWGWFIKGGLGVQIYNYYDGYIFKQETIEENPISGVNENPQYRMSASNSIDGIISPDHKLKDTRIRNEVYDLSTAENPFKTAGVVNIHMAAGLEYFYGEKTTFFLSPYYRGNVNSITKESALFKERINSMGISFGTQIQF